MNISSSSKVLSGLVSHHGPWKKLEDDRGCRLNQDHCTGEVSRTEVFPETAQN